MVTWAAACFMLCHFLLLKKTGSALGKCTVFVLMTNTWSLKILLLFQQLMQEALKAPLLFFPLHRLYSVCILITNVQFSSSGSCFQWVSQENLLIKYPLKFYCKIWQFQSLPSLWQYEPFACSTVMSCSTWETLWMTLSLNMHTM